MAILLVWLFANHFEQRTPHSSQRKINLLVIIVLLYMILFQTLEVKILVQYLSLPLHTPEVLTNNHDTRTLALSKVIFLLV
jgi:hypothetical protein